MESERSGHKHAHTGATLLHDAYSQFSVSGRAFRIPVHSSNFRSGNSKKQIQRRTCVEFVVLLVYLSRARAGNIFGSA